LLKLPPSLIEENRKYLTKDCTRYLKTCLKVMEGTLRIGQGTLPLALKVKEGTLLEGK
jgi:hypothetical protein